MAAADGETVDMEAPPAITVDVPLSDAAKPAVAATLAAAGVRLASIDAYRGFVMLLMASEGLGIGEVARELKGSAVWQFLAFQTDHVQWVGCSLWDLIQPSFSFLVGTSMAFSLAARKARGQTYGAMLRHAALRSVILIALGVVLRSDGKNQTNFTFEDTLTQIGLGYTFLFLLWGRSIRTQVVWAAGILLAYWLAFALYPRPPAGFDFAAVGVPSGWRHLAGFAAHWDKNTNFAAGFDRWFLNLFPREKPWVYNGGGYLTLSFIPTLVTMLFGLMAGELLRWRMPQQGKVRRLLIFGLAGLVLGWGLGMAGICPVVKRIWTPTWTIYSAGWCCLLLAGFYWIMEMRGRQRWAFPLVVVGMNSIAMYVLAHLTPDTIDRTLKTHLGEPVFALAGVYAPILESASVLLVLWLMCLWMYRRRLFLKI